jgi:hypothetical protein
MSPQPTTPTPVVGRELMRALGYLEADCSPPRLPDGQQYGRIELWRNHWFGYRGYQGDLPCREYILRFDPAGILRQWTRQDG